MVLYTKVIKKKKLTQLLTLPHMYLVAAIARQDKCTDMSYLQKNGAHN